MDAESEFVRARAAGSKAGVPWIVSSGAGVEFKPPLWEFVYAALGGLARIFGAQKGTSSLPVRT